MLVFSAAATSTPLTTQQRVDFIKTSTGSCVEKQKEDPRSKAYSDEQLTDYCNCYSVKMADVVSYEDLLRAGQTKDVEFLRKSIDAASETCGEIMSKKWGNK